MGHESCICWGGVSFGDHAKQAAIGVHVEDSRKRMGASFPLSCMESVRIQDDVHGDALHIRAEINEYIIEKNTASYAESKEPKKLISQAFDELKKENGGKEAYLDLKEKCKKPSYELPPASAALLRHYGFFVAGKVPTFVQERINAIEQKAYRRTFGLHGLFESDPAARALLDPDNMWVDPERHSTSEQSRQ